MSVFWSTEHTFLHCFSFVLPSSSARNFPFTAARSNLQVRVYFGTANLATTSLVDKTFLF
jgi:hypothetical protein